MIAGCLADNNYLPRALVLHDSMRENGWTEQFWLLALNRDCELSLQKLGVEGIKVVSLSEIVNYYPILNEVRKNRSLVEFYFTLSSYWSSYMLEHVRENEWIIYLDSDLCFYRNPAEVISLIKDQSVGIVEHRFSPRSAKRIKFGRFNVGWVSFKKDNVGGKVLTDWRNDCTIWCKDELDGDRYADQKYLDKWPFQFERVAIIDHKGVNLAPWNLENYKISQIGEGKDCLFSVDDDHLQFYHFQGIRRVYPFVYEINFERYSLKLNRNLKLLYRKYIKSINVYEKQILKLGLVEKNGETTSRYLNAKSKKKLRTKIMTIFYRCFRYKNWILVWP